MNELLLKITSPKDGDVLSKSPITVTGTVSDIGATVVVVVNGVEVRAAADGSFSAQIELSVGENIIHVAAATLYGLRVEVSVKVTYDPA